MPYLSRLEHPEFRGRPGATPRPAEAPRTHPDQSCAGGNLRPVKIASTAILIWVAEQDSSMDRDAPACTTQRAYAGSAWAVTANTGGDEGSFRTVSSASKPELDELESSITTRSHSLARQPSRDRKSTRLNSSHLGISYAVFCLKKKKHLRKIGMLVPLYCRRRRLPYTRFAL